MCSLSWSSMCQVPLPYVGLSGLRWMLASLAMILVRGVWMGWKVGVSIEWIRACRLLSADFSCRLIFMWTEYSPASGLMRIWLARHYYLGISICIMTGV